MENQLLSMQQGAKVMSPLNLRIKEKGTDVSTNIEKAHLGVPSEGEEGVSGEYAILVGLLVWAM